MSLISLTVPLLNGSRATVVGEQVTEHFALTPALAAREDDTVGLADHGRALTHIPSGLAVTNDDTFVDLREFARELEKLPVKWDNEVITTTSFTREQAEQIRAVHKRLWSDPTKDFPWPKWAGNEDTPALSLIAHLLDDYLEHAAQRYDKRRELKNAVAVHDAELAEQVGTQVLISSADATHETYGLVYLLGVLHRLAPADADRAARDLANIWAYGDSATDEFMHQWRQELADGLPLQLPGNFPDLPSVA